MTQTFSQLLLAGRLSLSALPFPNRATDTSLTCISKWPQSRQI